MIVARAQITIAGVKDGQDVNVFEIRPDTQVVKPTDIKHDSDVITVRVTRSGPKFAGKDCILELSTVEKGYSGIDLILVTPKVFWWAPDYSYFTLRARTIQQYGTVFIKVSCAGEHRNTRISCVSDGQDGMAAYIVSCSPSVAVFNTDKNGILLADVGVAIDVKQGERDVNVSGKISVVGAMNFTKAEARVGGNMVTLRKAGVAMQTVTNNGIATTLPCTSAAVELRIEVGSGITLAYTIPIAVNISKFLSSTYSDLKGFHREFTEFKGSERNLNEFRSGILQTARQISTEVSEKALGAVNLLKDSELKRLDSVSVRWPHLNVCVVKNRGYNGTNAMRVNLLGITGDDTNYNGLFWSGEHVVKIEKGATYTFSFLAMSPDPAKVEGVWSEIIFWDSPSGGRKSQITSMNIIEQLTASYKLFMQTFTIPETAQYEYIEITLFSLRNGEVYFSRPCLAKTDVYVGWSRSKDDKERICGNLLDGTKKFDGPKFQTQGTLVPNGHGDFTTLQNATLCRYLFSPGEIKANTDYMLSAWIKNAENVDITFRDWTHAVASCLLTENSDGQFITDSSQAKNGYSQLSPHAGFTRIWVHFRTAASVPAQIALIIAGGKIELYGLKLEEGAEMTDWTEEKETLTFSLKDFKSYVRQTAREVEINVTDGVNKAGLKLGADGGFTATGKNFKFQDSNGNTHLALTEDGKMKAEVIEADKVVATGIQSKTIDAKNATFENVNLRGNLEGVSGSFRYLKCVNARGETVATLRFSQDGKLEITGGDFQMQGLKDERALRFLASDIWCRGAFGHHQRTCAVIRNGIMHVYVGVGGTDGIRVRLPTVKLTSGETVYEIPMYGPGTKGILGDFGSLVNPKDPSLAGAPIDLVVFNCTANYLYSFTALGEGKEWTVINGNDDQSVRVVDIGGWRTVLGGEVSNYFYVNPTWLTPVSAAGSLGRGVFHAGISDLNWR